MQNIVEIKDGVTRHPLYRMKRPVNLAIAAGEQVAIVGRNGSGKSRLVDIITGRYPLLMNEVHYDFSPSPMKLVSDNIKYITFRDSYGDNDSTYYYQQRWNQHDIDEHTPTVGDILDEAFAAAEPCAVPGGFHLQLAFKDGYELRCPPRMRLARPVAAGLYL